MVKALKKTLNRSKFLIMYKIKGVCIKKNKAGCHIKKWHQKVNRFLIYEINKAQLRIKSYTVVLKITNVALLKITCLKIILSFWYDMHLKLGTWGR